jgi:hypothetical protein
MPFASALIPVELGLLAAAPSRGARLFFLLHHAATLFSIRHGLCGKQAMHPAVLFALIGVVLCLERRRPLRRAVDRGP